MLLTVVPMTVILLNHLQIFSRVCRPNSAAQNDVLCYQFVSQFDSYVGAQLNLSVSLDDVAISIGKLKKGKAPGNDGIMAEHLLHCHPIIFYVLLKLFKAIVSHRYVPMVLILLSRY